MLRRYLRLPGSVDEPFLMIDMTLDAGCTSSSFDDCAVWAHQNRLGSVVATTDAAGAIVDKYTYGAYGELWTQSASGFPFRFTGQKLDPETGLYYYKARYYDPETGRFLQTDPIGYEDQMNLYGYVGNDPVNLRDPLGNVTSCADNLTRGQCQMAKSDVQNGRERAGAAAKRLRQVQARLAKKGKDGLGKKDKAVVDAFEKEIGEFNDENVGAALGVLDAAANIGLGKPGDGNDLVLSGASSKFCSGGVACVRPDVFGQYVFFTPEYFDYDKGDRRIIAGHELFHLSGAALPDGGDVDYRQKNSRSLVGTPEALKNAQNYECYVYNTCRGTVSVTFQ